jgi:hypothetical protein
MEPPAPITAEGRRVVAVLGAVIAPTTLITALAFYFGWRRERAFAGYFGVDPSTLGYSTTDYVLRSVDALFVPFLVVLLVLFGAVALRSLLAGHLARPELPPIIGLAGAGALVVGILLAAGHPVSSAYVYLQALGIGVGALLIADALAHLRAASPAPVRYVAVAVALIGAFWATSEYADSRGLRQARRLAADITVNPQATIYSARDLDIEPKRFDDGCTALQVKKLGSGAYRYRYTGLTLLIRSGGTYFVTSVQKRRWSPRRNAVLLIPDDGSIRVELQRGPDYHEGGEKTAAGLGLPFAC